MSDSYSCSYVNQLCDELTEANAKIAALESQLTELRAACEARTDTEPVDEAWLRSLGWKDWEFDDEHEGGLWMPANSELGWKCRLVWQTNGIYVVRMAEDELSDYAGPSEAVELLDSRNTTKLVTRGDLLRLLDALKLTAALTSTGAR